MATIPRHRNSGNVPVLSSPVDASELHERLQQRPPDRSVGSASYHRMDTPERPAGGAARGQGGGGGGCWGGGGFCGLRQALAKWLSRRCCWSPQGGSAVLGAGSLAALAAVGALALAVFAAGAWLGRRWGEAGGAGADAAEEPDCALEALYGEKLQNITAGIAMLNGLAQVVVRADDTYEEIYHNQLVRHDLDGRKPEELDWSNFVQEARETGPVFLEGKESLRDAVASMHRLIRRAPDHLRSMIQQLQQQDAEEASWYLAKVVKLVDTVHVSMEGAAHKFAVVEAAVGGMFVDARENEEHLEGKASTLEVEAKALEGAPLQRSGTWTRTADMALHGCQLGKVRETLEACKVKCLQHGSGLCTQLAYYKTATGYNCYLHCESATAAAYREGDTFTLQKAPSELASEALQKRAAGVVAVQLRGRWRAVQAPLAEVTRLVRRFRGATADLRRSLEEARFAADDLRAAFATVASPPLCSSSSPSAPGIGPSDQEEMPGGSCSGGGGGGSAGSGPGGRSRTRLLERHVGELVAAIEDLGESVAPLRLQ